MPAITHNLLSQFTNRQLNITGNNKSKSSEKLSSGFRINRASDDAAGLAISEKMRWQVRGLNRASQNIQDGMSLLNVAEGALVDVHSMLQRMNELTIQAANDSNTYSDRSAIQREINQLLQAIEKVKSDTHFNTQPVFDGGTISGSGSVSGGGTVPPADPINDVTLSLPQGIDVAVNASNIDLLLHKNADGSYELEDGHTYTLASDITMATFHVSNGATTAIKNSTLKNCGIVCDNATLYISDVSITNSNGNCPQTLPASGYGYNGAPVTCNGNTTVNFLGVNYLNGGTYYLPQIGYNWKCYSGIQVDNGNHLILNGNGILNTSGGQGSSYYSGSSMGSPAIGSSLSRNNNPERSGDITIHSGYINAISNDYAAGIGGGGGGERGDEIGTVNGNIYIDGGFVHAESHGDGAAIGSGKFAGGRTPGRISISGGKVEAICWGRTGAGIGGSYGGNGADVIISGGTVLAKGGIYGSGIGSGSCFNGVGNKSPNPTSGNITISGGNVTAIGGVGDKDLFFLNRNPSAIGQGALTTLSGISLGTWNNGFGKLTVDGRTVDMYMEGQSQKDSEGRYIYTYQGKQEQPNPGQPEQPKPGDNNHSAKGLWWIQMGATEGNGIFISTGKISLQDLGLNDLEVYSHQKASFAITKVQNAIDKVSTIRAHIGAQYNRLEHGVRIAENTAENTQAAESRIRDTDMALEMVSQFKHSILQQAGQSMLAQANQIPAGVLKLLQ